MFNIKNKSVPTPPYFFYKRSRQENFRSFSSSINNLLNHCDGKSNGFTLAEVLITLVIIGVIAAITVPTLINKTNNQEYVSKLKKAYSTLAQATNLIIAEEGPATEWATSRSNVFNLYQKKLVNAKVCGTSSECLPQGGFYKKLNGDIDTYNVSSEAYHKLVLSDGVQIIFSDATNLCNINFGYTENPQYCAKIFIDINGAKKPNTMGRDYFGFALKKNSLVPMGCEPSANCETSAGSICTCKVLREGAINY